MISRTGSSDDQEPVDIDTDRGADIDYLSTDPDDDPGRDSDDDQAQPSGEPRGRAGWRSAIALLAVVLAAVSATWWDGGQRSDGAAQVLAATAEGRADADHADAFISSTIVYASPQLESAMLGREMRAGLLMLVANSAEEALAPVRADRDRLVSLAIPPWRGSLAGARDAAIGYLNQRIAVSEAIGHRANPPATTASVEQRLIAVRVALGQVRADPDFLAKVQIGLGDITN